jgi:uncharacterized membrane protein
MLNERLLRLKTGAIDETRKLFGIFIYLWVLLSLFSIIDSQSVKSAEKGGAVSTHRAMMRQEN